MYQKLTSKTSSSENRDCVNIFDETCLIKRAFKIGG